jgi:uncharacterized protein YodC (DUF2158 family)
MDQIANGDVLQLRSGGPLLTVVSVNEKTCECVWFDTTGNLHRSVFQLSAVAATVKPA